MQAVAAIPAVGLLVGSLIGFLAPDAIRPFAYTGLAAGALLALWAWHGGCPRLGAVAVAGTFAAGGVLLAADAWHQAWRPPLRVAFEALARGERERALAAHRVLPLDDEAFAIVAGVLRSDAALVATGVALSLDVDHVRAAGDASPGDSGTPVSGGVLVSVVGSLGPLHVDAWRAGRRVRLPVQLRRPSRYLDPGVPDGERALARRGTTLVGTVKSAALVDVVGDGPWWDEAAGSARLFARRAIGREVGRWSARSASIVDAIVIGDRVGLDSQVQQRLQEAGTYHVIAISGGNIAILAGLLLGACRLAGVLGRGAMLAVIGLLVAYAYFVGGGPSVSRATLMATVYFASRAWDQRSAPLNTFWIVVAAMVAAAPLSATDPAFVLTCGATLGILVLAPMEGAVPRQWPALVRTVALMGAASLAAEVMLLPMGAVFFSRITFAGLALNFLAIPLMGVAQVAGMCVVPLALVSAPMAGLAGFVAHLGAAGLVWSADLVRYVPQATFRVAQPTWAVVCAYYLALGWWWTGRRRAWVPCAAIVVAATWIIAEPWAWLAARGDGRLHVTFLDVGQGDSVLVRFPRGTTMLVDAGGLGRSSSFDIGDRVVAPVLRQAGIRRLDYVVLSHGDPDHIGGLPSIIREFRPREVWEGIPVPSFEPLTALRVQTQALGARWANVYAGDRIRVDDVEVLARHPMLADWERRRVRNDDSLVLDLRWRNVSVLLTGDVGKGVERSLEEDGTRPVVRILKVPHHGSLTSSSVDFLRRLAPQVAVFSVGRGNHFGHPAPDVLDRYRDVGAAIFRTDRDGAVTLDTDGRSIELRSFAGRHAVLSIDRVYREDASVSGLR